MSARRYDRGNAIAGAVRRTGLPTRWSISDGIHFVTGQVLAIDGGLSQR